MPKPRTRKPATAPDCSIRTVATARQITTTGREYQPSPELRLAAQRAQFQPRLINICSNVQD
ncbi:hypothetical protein [Achromobacter pestifer]